MRRGSKNRRMPCTCGRGNTSGIVRQKVNEGPVVEALGVAVGEAGRKALPGNTDPSVVALKVAYEGREVLAGIEPVLEECSRWVGLH